MIENRKVMAKNILKYMGKNNVNASEICKALNIKQNTFSDWINAKTYPRIDKVEMLANYFGITKSDLVEEATSDNKYYEDEDAAELAEFVHKNPEYKVLFDASRKVQAKDIDFVRQMIERMSNNED